MKSSNVKITIEPNLLRPSADQWPVLRQYFDVAVEVLKRRDFRVRLKNVLGQKSLRKLIARHRRKRGAELIAVSDFYWVGLRWPNVLNLTPLTLQYARRSLSPIFVSPHPRLSGVIRNTGNWSAMAARALSIAASAALAATAMESCISLVWIAAERRVCRDCFSPARQSITVEIVRPAVKMTSQRVKNATGSLVVRSQRLLHTSVLWPELSAVS